MVARCFASPSRGARWVVGALFTFGLGLRALSGRCSEAAPTRSGLCWAIAGEAHEVSDLAAVRVRAMAVLARHPLRAADADQLGAALLVADPNPSSLQMAVLDNRLAEAAAREGLQVLTWE